MEQIINFKHLRQINAISSSFKNASPFKHTLIEGFLNEQFLDDIRKEFPKPPGSEELINEFGGKSRKHAVHNIRELGQAFRDWDDLLKSELFIQWLSELTGIDGLLYDPEYHGAGTHNNMHGQGMDVHIDFNMHRTTGYHRRLNLIVYISEEWEKEWGGALEIHKNPWKPEEDEWKSYPSFGNNAIIFETNEISWHGFEEINLPEHKRHLSRKSLTVYYYTKERPKEEIARKHSTIYVQKPLPSHITPGYTINEADYAGLKKNFEKRNLFLKGLYDRETQLLERIENQNHLLKVYSDAFQTPTVGFVKQVGKVSGLQPSMKVNDIISIEFEALTDIKNLTIEGFVPKFIREGKNKIRVTIDGQLIEIVPVEGLFKTSHPLNLVKGNKFHLQIQPQDFVSPFDMEINNDKNAVGFVLHSLIFV